MIQLVTLLLNLEEQLGIFCVINFTFQSVAGGEDFSDGSAGVLNSSAGIYEPFALPGGYIPRASLRTSNATNKSRSYGFHDYTPKTLVSSPLELASPAYEPAALPTSPMVLKIPLNSDGVLLLAMLLAWYRYIALWSE